MANTFDVHYPEIWSKHLINRLDAMSKMLPHVNRQLEAEMASEGDVVRRQKVGAVTIGTYSPGSDMTTTDVTSTDDTLTLDQMKYFNFIIDETEIARATNKYSLVNEYTKQAMADLGRTIDTFLLAKSSSVDSGNIIGSASLPVTLTEDNIHDYALECRRLIVEDNVEPSNLVMIIDPITEELILKSPKYVQATALGDSRVQSAKISGKFAGFDVVVSNRIATSSGVKDLLFYNRELFLDVVLRIPPKKVTFDPEKRFGTGVKGLAFYGANAFHPTAAAVIKKAA